MNRLWAGGLAGLMLLSLAVRWIHLGSDAPLDAAGDLSLTIDGSWYAGAAIDWATGRPSSLPATYDPPIYGALARAVVWIAGPGHWSASLVNVLAGLLAVGLTAAAVRRVHGPAAGLAAGALLSFSYPFLVYSRTPGIYVPAAACAAAVFYFEARRQGSAGRKRMAWAAAEASAAIAGIAGIKPILALTAASQAACSFLPVLRRGGAMRWKTLSIGIAACFAAAALLRLSGWLDPQIDKVADYLTRGGGLEDLPQRALALESRLGLFRLAPLLAASGMLGLLFLPAEPLHRLAAASVLFHGGVLAILGYSPIRYLLPAFPALAILGAGALERWWTDGGRQPAAVPGRGWRIIRAALLAYGLLQALQALPMRGGANRAAGDDAAVLCLCLILAALGAIFLEIRLARRPVLLRPAFLTLASLAALLLAPELLRTAPALAEPQTSVARAGEEVGWILDPSAHLTGPFAHVLTQETGHRRTFVPLLNFGKGRLERELRRTGASHLAVDVSGGHEHFLRVFKSHGVPLRLVHELWLRGCKVHLYRFPWADGIAPASEFERGVFAMQDGDWSGAASLLEEAAGRFPQSSAILSAWGAALLRQGGPEAARNVLETASLLNPYELSALRSLAAIRLQKGDAPGAGRLLDRILAAAPGDREAARIRRTIP